MSKTKKTSKKSAKPEIPTGFEDVLTYVAGAASIHEDV